MNTDPDYENFQDIIRSFECLRKNPHLPKKARANLEKAHQVFMHNGVAEPLVALQAYWYGRTIGAHTGPQEALPEADRLLQKADQSRRGKISGEKRRESRPWTDHAKDLALKIREEDSSLSQDRVASEIEMGWKLKLECPAHPTLKQFVSDLEKAGELPKRLQKPKS